MDENCFSDGSTAEDYLLEVEKCDGEEGVENDGEGAEVETCDGEEGVADDGDGVEVRWEEDATMELSVERDDVGQYPA
ncbi:hypothetical protein A2U01_0067437, partial [Trifolium medium]|nr:hypothetical protein [Trifolium medium]